MIDWDNSITLTSLKSQTTFVVRMNGNTLTGTGTTIPILTINYHANGGTIDSTITGHKYEVTANEGLNMRSGAGTSNSLVKSFAKGTTFTVDVGNTKNANGYTWGKTTIDGKTGWVVISDFVSEIAVLRNTDYYLSSSLVYKTSTSDAINDKILYGVTFPNGLYNASTFKLTREGYRFVGWSASPDGSTTVFDQDAALKAEDVCPELKDGNKSITLYAIWEKDCSENHNYQYSLSTAPTASATGTLTGTCTVCAGTTTITLPKLSATDYTYSVTKAATCTEAGTGCYTWKTTTYGSFVFDITIAALGHDYQNGICTRCLEKDPDYTVVDPNAPSIVIGNTTGTAGDTVTVTVDLKNNPGFGGMAYNVYYDSSVLELISYELGIGAAICVDSGIDGYVGRVNFQYGGITNVTGDGILVTITFKIKENAKEGFTAITVVPEKGSSFRYEGRNEIDFDLVGIDGGITVIDYIKGDINGDGAVNNRDAVRLMQYLAGWDVEITEAAMDANGDGTVNNRDAIRIMQYLAGWEVELF